MLMPHQLNLLFDHTYECEVVSETTGCESRKIFYPGAVGVGGGDGLIVNVIPYKGDPWLGIFAFDQTAHKGVTGIFSTPNPECFCVVARGNAFIVSASNPNIWEPVCAIPIIDVRSIVKHGIIVFANFTELLAYDSQGLKWHTKRLTWDSMKVVEITDDFLKGEFWDIRSESTQNFTVDLITGSHQGGINI
jgi:hypothetical protein